MSSVECLQRRVGRLQRVLSTGDADSGREALRLPSLYARVEALERRLRQCTGGEPPILDATQYRLLNEQTDTAPGVSKEEREARLAVIQSSARLIYSLQSQLAALYELQQMPPLNTFMALADARDDRLPGLVQTQLQQERRVLDLVERTVGLMQRWRLIGVHLVNAFFKESNQRIHSAYSLVV